MKAASFDYVRATSVDEVCRLLADAGDEERKIIAGGQTLVPLMAMRMARPDMIIDINDIAELTGIADRGGDVEIAAGTRQRAVERSTLVSDRLPLLARAVRWVGHQQTRNRGTVGGSIVHGDPSAEIPLTAQTLGATLVLKSLSGTREIAIDGFFEAAMMTAIDPGEILTAVRFPVWDGGRVGTGFHETSSRDSDFAIVAAAAQVQLDADGACVRAAVGVGGVAPAPVRLDAVAAALTGGPADDAAIAAAFAHLDSAIDPDTDVHATADYRRRVARVLAGRALSDAAREAAR